MVKLVCLGAKPLRRNPVLVERWGYRRFLPNEMTHELDETEANLVMAAYPDCFKRVEMPQVEKIKTNKRDKMLVKEVFVEKEFE